MPETETHPTNALDATTDTAITPTEPVKPDTPQPNALTPEMPKKGYQKHPRVMHDFYCFRCKFRGKTYKQTPKVCPNCGNTKWKTHPNKELYKLLRDMTWEAYQTKCTIGGIVPKSPEELWIELGIPMPEKHQGV